MTVLNVHAVSALMRVVDVVNVVRGLNEGKGRPAPARVQALIDVAREHLDSVERFLARAPA